MLVVAVAAAQIAPALAQAYPDDRRYPPGYDRPQVQPPYYGDDRGGRLTCESRDGSQQRCAANTQGRVVVLRQLSRTRCVEGRNFRYNRRAIIVDGGCRAEFGFGRQWAGGGYPGQPGYPGQYPQPDRDRGPGAGAVIAGVAVAGGLIALLASQNRKKQAERAAAGTAATIDDRDANRALGAGLPENYRPGPPASISAEFRDLPADARAVAQTCMFEAARQIGATGGTRVTYDRLVKLDPGNGGYRIRADLTAIYPDGARPLPMYCRATPTRVVELDFNA